MNSLPGKYKCSALEWFSCPEGITPNSGLTWPNITYIYIYIYIYLIWFCWVLWHINHYRWFIPNPVYTYITYIWFDFFGFYRISIIVGYLMPNPIYTNILNIYDLVSCGFYCISNIVGYVNAKSYLYKYIIYIRLGFVWVLWHINHCRSFNAKSYLYIYKIYMTSRDIL